jgi:hypothetical protein
MDYRRLAGKSINDIEDEVEEDNNDDNYGGLEKNAELRIKNDINRKKYFKQENKD